MRYTLAEGLTLPSGVAVHEGDLYIAAVSHLYRLKSIENTLATPPGLEVITDALPTDKHHGWKHIEFDGEGKLVGRFGMRELSHKVVESAIRALN